MGMITCPFIIKAVEPKKHKPVNPYHELMIGRYCAVCRLEKERPALLAVDMPYDAGNPHRFLTSDVVGFTVFGSQFYIETANTKYAFERVQKDRERTYFITWETEETYDDLFG